MTRKLKSEQTMSREREATRPVVTYETGSIKLEVEATEFNFSEMTTTEVEVSINGTDTSMSFHEGVPWDDVENAVLSKLAEATVKRMDDTLDLPSHEGYESHVYDEESDEMKLLLMVAHQGIAHTSDINKMEEQIGNTNCSKNLKHANQLASVASDAQYRFYYVTEEGMKKIIGVFGMTDWRSEAEDVMAELFDEDYSPTHMADRITGVGLEAFRTDNS